MKIMFLSSGNRVPSSRFRVYPYIPHLRAAGHRCTVCASVPQKYDYYPAIGFRPSQRLKRLVRWWHLLRAWCGRYDVIVIDREIFDDDTSSMEARFRDVTKTLVVDVDDAVFLRHPEKFTRVVEMCDLVIAGNRFLKEHVEPLNPQILIIPTCIDTEVYPRKPAAPENTEAPVIGWMGTTANLRYLDVAAKALRTLAKRFSFELRLIAGERGPLDSIDFDGVHVNHIPWNGDTEVQELLKFDIGLMPLHADDEWNRYKCGLKLLQYMAIGIPGVASPVGVNAEIIDHGVNGFLAETSDEWIGVLARLIEDAALRQTIGDAARETVEEQYSIQMHWPRLAAGLEAVIRRESVDQI